MKINKLIKPIDEGYVVKSKNKSLSEKYYVCPKCHNRTLGEVSENDDLYICDECGAEGRGYETFEGNIAFYDDVDESKFDPSHNKVVNFYDLEYDISNVRRWRISFAYDKELGNDRWSGIVVASNEQEAIENYKYKVGGFGVGWRVVSVKPLGDASDRQKLKWAYTVRNRFINCDKPIPAGIEEFIQNVALDESKSINEGTFSRVINKIRKATLDEYDPNNRKLYNFIDKFKKEFNIDAKIHNAGYGYIKEGDKEIRNYRAYIECSYDKLRDFFIDGIIKSNNLKPEYTDRFTLNGDRTYKTSSEMDNNEIQVEISPGNETIYFDLHVIMDSDKAERQREKSANRLNKAYKNESKSIKEESKSWGGHKHPEQDKIEKALMAINGTTKVEFDYRPDDGVYKVPENHLIILPFCRDDKVFGDGSEYFKNRKKWKDSVLAKLRQLGWTQEDPMEDNDTYLYLVMKKSPKMKVSESKPVKTLGGKGKSLNEATRIPQESLDEDSNRYRDPDNGKVMLDRWYAAKYPDDEVGIDQLDGLYMDDALKDRSILGHCDTQVRDRVYQQLDRYIPLSVDSPMYKEIVTESMSGFVQTNCANCGKKNKVEVHFPEYNKGFETTTYTCSHCGEQNELSDPHQYNDDGTINEAVDYKVKFFQVFETPKSPKESGKMIGQRGTLDDANAFGKEKVGEGNYIIKAVCDDGQTRPIDNDTKSDAFKMINEDTVVPSSYEFDDDVDDLTYYYDDELFKDNLENSPYTEIASKQVMDSDGFMTDYTMYMNINTGEYVFVFGDKDVYSPDDGYFDWECETEAEARAWFDNYTGFSDDLDDMDESLDLTKDEIELLLMGQDMGSWYDEILDNEEILNRYYDAENKAKKIATAKNMDFADYLDTLQINEEVSGNSDGDNSSQTKPSPVKSTDKNQEESPIVAKKSDGSYLIPASNGDGYVAFNRSDVCMGNISAANENEAKGKFNANKFDESINEKLEGSGWWSVEWDLTLEGEEIGFDDLSESTQEHIADSILDGCLQGEIAEWNDDEETEDYGWWVARFDISVEDNDRVRFEDLSETSQEQISNAIKDGYVSGEIFE